MSSTPVTVNATLVTCSVDIIANAGDKLIVFGGVCLGVHEETLTEHIPRRVYKRRKLDAATLSPEAIMATLSWRPLHAYDVADKLNVIDLDKATRENIRNLLDRMAKSGQISYGRYVGSTRRVYWTGTLNKANAEAIEVIPPDAPADA
jgi:hypothetical protein